MRILFKLARDGLNTTCVIRPAGCCFISVDTSIGHIDWAIISVGKHRRTPKRRRNECIDSDALKCRTIVERIVSNARDTIGDRDACECGTTLERTTLNARDAVPDRDARKRRATGERRTLNSLNTVSDCDACEGCKIFTRLGANGCPTYEDNNLQVSFWHTLNGNGGNDCVCDRTT